MALQSAPVSAALVDLGIDTFTRSLSAFGQPVANGAVERVVEREPTFRQVPPNERLDVRVGSHGYPHDNMMLRPYFQCWLDSLCAQ